MATGTSTVQLELEGMTCAACAARIERKLNRVEGVQAAVNLAAERATVQVAEGVSVEQLVAAVQAAGYGARPAGDEHAHHADPIGRRLLAAVTLTVPVALLAMVPPLRFGGWEWAALALTTPVVLFAGAGFHRAAVRAARHGATTMDSLVSLGTLAAWAWSAVVLVAGLEAEVYFEVAAVITTVILLGRWLEGRARTRSSDAIRKLLELAPKQARVLRDGEEVLVPAAELVAGDVFVVRPGEQIATDGIVTSGESASTARC